MDELPLAQSTVSQHLKVLKEAGLIRGDIDGPRVCYCIEPRALRRLKALIGGLCAFRSDSSSFIDDLRKDDKQVSKTLRVYDPAMCCSTGVCGTSIDPELARFAADIDWLSKHGVSVERFNLAQQPGAFAESALVKEALARGTQVLPLLVMDDKIVAEGVYPSRDALAAMAGVVLKKLSIAPATEASKSCCAPSSDSKASCC